MNSTHTVPTTSTNHQQNATSSTEKMLITALMVVDIIAIGPLVYIVKLSAPDLSTIAQVAVTTIGTITLATISAIALALRRRPTRGRR